MLARIVFSVLLVCILVLFIGTEARMGKKAKAARSEGRQPQAKDCSGWTFGECTLSNNATCGKGLKKGARTGENCAVKEKSFPCKVPCAKNKCKYQKGDWSECDPTTNQMTRTNTLKKGDTSVCSPTKVINKKCKNKKVGGRQNNNRKRKGGAQ